MTAHDSAAPQPTRPTWVPDELYPFADHYLDLDEALVHYIDEGDGPPLLMLHGNPTWSFLYRNLVLGLRDRFRCIALDYPGFGLSSAAPGYRFTPGEHAGVVSRLIERLDLREITLVVQDWGGPIGFAAATRHPDRFAAFVIGNTWAWPKTDPGTQVFSRFLGGPVGGWLIRERNFFVERILPSGVRRTTLSDTVMNAYRGPFPTPASRRPVHAFPREILGSRDLLADIERKLPTVADRPALIVWGDKDLAFRSNERRRWEQIFRRHHTVALEGASHFVQEDAPEEIITAIRSWSST
ncbi:alpha/beta fold hydrolase [Nocardia sp. CNY236]|uniref:alpha/beta fold hydrolase n=1 Tax=Nocardia sp. CNY236 TaxID=1169152 RepID=UPI0004165A35|nr:alpha/beta fold hydrolase [Nocardia sp. CNY236]